MEETKSKKKKIKKVFTFFQKGTVLEVEYYQKRIVNGVIENCFETIYTQKDVPQKCICFWKFIGDYGEINNGDKMELDSIKSLQIKSYQNKDKTKTIFNLIIHCDVKKVLRKNVSNDDLEDLLDDDTLGLSNDMQDNVYKDLDKQTYDEWEDDII
jgi:hypothetical protein